QHCTRANGAGALLHPDRASRAEPRHRRADAAAADGSGAEDNARLPDRRRSADDRCRRGGGSAGGAPSRVAGRRQSAPDHPAAIGGGAQAVTVEPARVQLNPGSAPPNDSVTLLGSKLTTGVAQSLVLRAAAWSRLTPPVNRVELDPAMNPGWSLSLAADRIDFRAQPNLAFIDGGVPRIVDVLPGI